MTLLPPGVKVHLAFGYTDMRKSIDGLAMLVQEVLRQDPFSGHLFVFRGKANLLKIVFWDGTGLCLFTKRLEQGVFLSPSNVEPGGTLPSEFGAAVDADGWRRLACTRPAMAPSRARLNGATIFCAAVDWLQSDDRRGCSCESALESEREHQSRHPAL